MKNTVDEGVPIVEIKIDRVRKPADEYAPKGIKTDGIKQGMLSNQCEGVLKTVQEILPQPWIFLLVPSVGVRNVGHRLRQQNNGSTHRRNGSGSWPAPTVCLTQEPTGNELCGHALPRQQRANPARSSALRQLNSTSLPSAASVQLRARSIVQLMQSYGKVKSTFRDTQGKGSVPNFAYLACFAVD